MIGGTLASVGVASIAGIGMASAAATTNGQSTLVDKLVAKFHLNKDDVQKVFDEDRASHQAEREQKMKARLDQAVKDSKITQDQEDKLIAKLKEMESQRSANRDAMKDKTEEERKAAMDKERADFKQWLSDNKIPEDLVPGPMGHGHRMGM